MNKLAVFASGSGTNALAIMQYFDNHPSVEVSVIVCNKPGAGVIRKAERCNVPVYMLTRDDFYQQANVDRMLREKGVNWIILAGFLWLVPARIINAYPGRIINIHPALLPKFGGKGMYGIHVHRAVLESGSRESGITIHRVDHRYDEGEIIRQEKCEVKIGDTPETLANRIHELEHRYFPETIEQTILNSPV